MPVSLKKVRNKSVRCNDIIEITPKHIMTEEQSLELLQKDDIFNEHIADKANVSLSIEPKINSIWNTDNIISKEEDACLDALFCILKEHNLVFSAVFHEKYHTCFKDNLHRKGRQIFLDTSMLHVKNSCNGKLTSNTLTLITEFIQVLFSGNSSKDVILSSLTKLCKDLPIEGTSNLFAFFHPLHSFITDAFTTGQIAQQSIIEGKHKWENLAWITLYYKYVNFTYSILTQLYNVLLRHNCCKASLFVLANIIEYRKECKHTFPKNSLLITAYRPYLNKKRVNLVDYGSDCDGIWFACLALTVFTVGMCSISTGLLSAPSILTYVLATIFLILGLGFFALETYLIVDAFRAKRFYKKLTKDSKRIPLVKQHFESFDETSY